jgi:hypothetical protein
MLSIVEDKKSCLILLIDGNIRPSGAISGNIPKNAVAGNVE